MSGIADPTAEPDRIPSDDAAALKRRSIHGAAATLVAQALRFLLQFGSQLLLARLLMPAEFGVVAMIGPILGFVGICNELGLSQATVQREHISRQQSSNLFWINIAVSGALALLLCLAAPMLAWFYGEPRLTGATRWMSVLLLIGGASAQPLALMNRRMRFVRLAGIDVACTLVAVAVGIAAAAHGMGYHALILMQAVNATTICAMAWAWAAWWPSLPRRAAGTWPLLRFGSHMTATNLIAFAGANVDSVLIGKVGGSVALGLYDRAFKLVATPIWNISMPVARVADPLLARLRDHPGRYRRAYLLMLQMLLLMTLPAVAFTAVSAATLVPFLLGPGWTTATPIVAWLAIATGFAPLGISASWLFVSQGRAAALTRFAALRSAVMIAAVLAGLPWGAEGVARSYALLGLLIHGLPLWGATRRGPVDYRYIVRGCIPVAAGGAAAALAVFAVDARMRAAGFPEGPRLIIGVLLAYAGCGATVLCFPSGQRLLREVWHLRSSLRGGPA